MENKYILMTGSINNAGDFLIKHRARQLLSMIRPDRVLEDYDRRSPIDNSLLEKINASKALILLGGPALQKNMYPELFPLREKLDDIKVPILTMGIGWKSLNGDWLATQDYALSSGTKSLLRKISKNNVDSSVRDYFTLHVLNRYGVSNVRMTGCPALYVPKYFDIPIHIPSKIRRISFSVGVSFVQSDKMYRQAKDIILGLKKKFATATIDAVFHHSLDEKYLQKYNNQTFFKKNKEFSLWLKKNDINVVDVSGEAEKMIDQYSKSDLHVGYRVHAHILASSISKPSILIAEDGRGKGLYQVIGGLIFDGFRDVKKDYFTKIIRKFRIADTYNALPRLHQDILNAIDYEIKTGCPRIGVVRQNINNHFSIMKDFLESLP